MRFRDLLLALLTPPACLACGAPLAGAGAALCAGCRAMVPWLRGLRCARCALPLCGATERAALVTGAPPPAAAAAPLRLAGPTCRRCPAAEAAFDTSWTPVAYAGPARALVTTLKFRGTSAAADVMAAQIAATAPPGLLTEGTLVPVPAHRARRRERGFNQAERLAGALARRTGRPARPCLHRTGAPARQLGARRSARLSAGRISISASGAVPAVAVLVDDVYTTGATLDACARALRQAGSRTVRAVAYARTLDSTPTRIYDGS